MAMSDSQSNLRPSSTRRSLATAIAVIGIVVVAQRLMAHWPRDVEIVYEFGPQVTKLDVDYVYEEGASASARFRQSESKTTVFRHLLRLQPGEYRVLITLHGSEGPATEHAKTLVVPAEGVTRFDLQEITTRSE
jgi:hypothetical protein